LWSKEWVVLHAGGGKGTVIKTIDAGATWSNISAPTVKLIRAIHFPHPDSGYIAGDGSTVFRTYNGGATWDSIATVPSGHTYLGVYFRDKKYGFLAGTSGGFYRTNDEGLNWTKIYPADSDTMYTAIVFPTNSIGYVSGNNSLIAKTTDGGMTWTKQNSNFIKTTGNTLWEIDCSDENHCIAGGGYGKLFRTIDGGKTWYDTWFTTEFGQEIRGLALYKDGTAGYTANVAAQHNKLTIQADARPVITPSGPDITTTFADNYLWYVDRQVDSGSYFQTYLSPLDGIYQVVTVNSNCFAISDAYYLNISNIVQTELDKNEIAVYPNPTKGPLKISGLDDEKSVVVLNNAGQKVYEGLVSGLNLSGMRKGVFLVVIEGEIRKVMLY
jgi:photosystem II stability/assembly factor-like uncharacterized protein